MQEDLQQAPAEDVTPEVAPEEAPAEKVVVLPGNCDGELEAQPQVEGVTYTAYKCKVCGEIVYVGNEHEALYGLPTQHHKREEDK